MLRAVHALEDAAARIVEALSAMDLATGGFYASKPKSVTGPLAEQGQFFAELADHRIQDNAAGAVERCLDRAR